MHLVIDTVSSTPTHEQIHDQIVRLVLAGTLTADTRMPSIRQLAADLGIANGTVARAYQDLEREDFLRTRRPQGTFVRARNPQRSETRKALRALAEHFAAQAAQLGITADEATAAVAAAYPHL